MLKNPKVQLLVGVLVSAGFLWYVLRGVDMAQLGAALRAFNWWWAGPFLAVNFFSLWLRAVRWKYLLAPSGKFTARRLWSPVMIGFGLNSLFPARAGEFARAAVLAIKERLGFAPVFGTIVVERMFDMVTLLVLLTAVFATLPIDRAYSVQLWGRTLTGQTLRDASQSIALGFSVILAGILSLMVPRTRDLARAAMLRLPGVPPRLREKLADFIDGLAKGLASLRDWRSTLAVVALSFAVWLSIAWSMQLAGYGFEGMRMTLMQGVAVTVIACLVIVIPASPGYWGLVEVGFVFSLLVLGVDKGLAPAAAYSRAVAYALIVHSLQYFPILALGLWYFWREGITFNDLNREREAATPAQAPA